MKVQIEDVSPVVKRLAIEVDARKVDDAISAMYSRLSRTVKLKGYRQGHVPRRLLERYFKSDVEHDVAKNLVESTIAEALKEHAIAAVAPPMVTNEGVAEGKSFKYSARVEVKPQVEPKDYEGLEAARPSAAVSDHDVESELEKLRESQAQVVPVQDRAAAELGDMAVIDYEGKIGGKPFKGGKGEGITLTIGEGGAFIEGFAPMLAGAQVGIPAEIDYTFPPDYRIPDLRGLTAKFTVTIRQLKTRELPALDDEFAKDLGAESLAALKESVKRDMEARAKDRAEAGLRDAIQKALVEKNPLEVPPAMVDRAIQVMIEGTTQGFARAGVDLRKALDVDRLAQDLRPQAETMVKAQLLLEGVARKENLAADEAEMEEHVKKVARESKLPEEKVRAHYRVEENKNGLLARLRQDKALAFLITRAKIQESR